MSKMPRLFQVLTVLILALFLSAGTAGAAKAPTTAAATTARGMWIWDRPATKTVIDFAKVNGVNDLVVFVPDTPDLAWLSDLRAQSRAVGMQMHALGSETWWLDQPDAAVAWQQRVTQTGLFDGFHFDVEPWLHADWNTDQPSVVAKYLQFLDAVTATDLSVDLDVSFWLYGISAPDGSRLDEAVLARVDAITVMSYRDTATGPDSITSISAPTLDAAVRAGKPARLAVETNYLGPTAVDAKQTFYGERRSRMSSVMAAVDTAMAGNSAYAGIVVHDRRGWAAMRK